MLVCTAAVTRIRPTTKMWQLQPAVAMTTMTSRAMTHRPSTRPITAPGVARDRVAMCSYDWIAATPTDSHLTHLIIAIMAAGTIFLLGEQKFKDFSVRVGKNW